ncbi:MAG: Crp/Fnr family transcriptional regulator [Treponemataceae bacterium]
MTEVAGKDRFLKTFGFLFPQKEWPPEKLEAVLATVAYRDLEAGTTILREGQTCASVPFVIEGAIRVFKTAETGREITLYRIERGQTCILSLGCGSGFSSFPASVVAEKATSAAFLPKETIRELYAEGAAFRDYVIGQYSSRMAEVIELVEEVAFRRVDERLAQRLGELGAGSSAGHIVATHQELADHVGTSREVVSRILKDWEQRGVLEIARGSLTLLSGFKKILV